MNLKIPLVGILMLLSGCVMRNTGQSGPESKVTRFEDFVIVADLRATKIESVNNIRDSLAAKNIPVSFEGSFGYAVFVPKTNASEAILILKTNALAVAHRLIVYDPPVEPSFAPVPKNIRAK